MHSPSPSPAWRSDNLGVQLVLTVSEKWYPGVFDILGLSHQVMRLLVIYGAVTNH
jgi:hypothetical protein